MVKLIHGTLRVFPLMCRLVHICIVLRITEIWDSFQPEEDRDPIDDAAKDPPYFLEALLEQFN